MNIVLKELRFSNMFSYGANNCIKLNDNRIKQLSAINGSGKTSIALILQELLFSKNVKGIKKTDILNRYIKDKNWQGELDFSVDGISYNVSVKRQGASTKLSLFKDGVDISEHKVLDTYKKIQEILGLDFSVFSQLTYQSSVDLLDFLKATDTNRKKFLINLFNLEKYLEIGDTVKLQSGSLDKEILVLQGELKSIDNFLQNTTIPTVRVEKDSPTIDMTLYEELSNINSELANINTTCKNIDKNNLYIKERNSLRFEIGLKEPQEFEHKERFNTLKMDLLMLKKEINNLKKDKEAITIKDTCDACGQPIDNSHIKKIKEQLTLQIVEKENIYSENIVLYKQWESEIQSIQQAKEEFLENKAKIDRFEQLTQLIDNTIPETYPDAQYLTNRKIELLNEISSYEQELDKVTKYNKEVSGHNAKVEALIEQKSEFLIRQSSLKEDILNKSSRATSLTILKKAFSTSGIVAFKLENLTKELENSINHYLSMLSDGQFQVEFLLDKEKLNISVIDNGKSAPIETMSGGEFSRIQTAILLAIRSLLSKLGGSSINLLFLDEITGVLDEEGKEKLVEVLQREERLNVFLISHDFTHPLIDKVIISKENNISYIQS